MQPFLEHSQLEKGLPTMDRVPYCWQLIGQLDLAGGLLYPDDWNITVTELNQSADSYRPASEVHGGCFISKD